MKYGRLLLVLSAFLLFQTAAFSAELAAPGTPARKLQRGFLNVALSPFEISNEMARDKKVDAFPPTWVTGLGRGLCYAVGRSLVGIGEILTFPVSAPDNYGPVLQPEFAWQHVPDKPAEKKK
jgi:putative exosortase-associated protein (TIGR04073 family)